MKVKLKKEIIKKFPDLNIGVVVASNIINRGKHEEIINLLEEVEELIRNEVKAGDINQKKYNTSVETLVKKIISGKKINIVNKLVDIYRYISLKYLIPAGGFDLDQIHGDIELAVSDGSDFFVPAGKGKKEKAKKGEIIYKDSIEVLCRKWNWKYAYKTRITERTRKAIVFIDGIPPVGKRDVEDIISELKDLILMFCKGEVNSFILNKDEPEREI